MEVCSLNITEHLSVCLLHVGERFMHMLSFINQQIYIIDYALVDLFLLQQS